MVGSGAVAEQCVLGLLRNGAGVVAIESDLADSNDARATELVRLEADGCPPDVRLLAPHSGPIGLADLAGYGVVLIAGDHPESQLHLLETAGLSPGMVALGAWAFGQRVVVGPMLTSDTRSLWTSAVLRLGANVDPAAEAQIWAAVARGVTSGRTGVSGPVAAMIGNLLAYECFRFVTGALPAETVGALIIQDVNSLDVAVEPIRSHPAFDAGPMAVLEPELPLRVDRAAGPDRSTSSDEDPQAVALNARRTMVQTHTGIVTGFTDGPWTQIPLKVTSVRVNPSRSSSREIVACDIHTVAGARLRALEAAALVYVEQVAALPARPDQEGRAPAAGELPVIDPRRLSISNGNRWVPGELVQGRMLNGRGEVLLPVEALQPARAPERRCIQVTSAGAGAGLDPGQAVARGLGTAIAHRALLLAIRGSEAVLIRPAALLTESGSDFRCDEVRFLFRSAAGLQFPVELLDLGESNRSGAHVVLARSTGNDPDWTISCGLDRIEAARDALRDLVGRRQLRNESSPPSGGDPDPGDSLLADLDPMLIRTATALPVLRAAPTEWADVVTALDQEGIDTIVVSTTPSDLSDSGIETAKVLLSTRPVAAG